MHLTRISEAKRGLAYTAFVVGLVAVSLIFIARINTADASPALNDVAAKASVHSAAAATFPADAASLGAIPDSDITSPSCQNNSTTFRDVTFTVSGISGSPSSVAVDFNASHPFLQDLEVTLTAPSGQSMLLFAATGTTSATPNTCAGSSSDLLSANTYTFSDAASANWWTTAATNPVPTSNNRTVITGIGGAANPPATTSLNAAFAGATANGTWKLRFRDRGSQDTGTVTAANLTISSGVANVQHVVDYDGDGKTDYSVVRNIGAVPGGSSNQIRWFNRLSSNGAESVGDWGDAATDYIVPADYDGDGKTDLVVWREAPATQAAFYILRSQTNTLDVQLFGQTGDDPRVSGDYDGDGKADPAVYRCPALAAPAGQCYFFYRGSQANPSGGVTYVPWGFGNAGSFFPNTGDFDGDGRNDFCIQRSDPSAPAQGQFVLLKSNGSGVEYINWGLSSDFILPGDYDGDGRSDFMVRRTVGGVRQNWLLTRTGATSMTPWGITGDTSVPGDYDGDGKTDLAIWRGSTDPAANFFWVLRSGTGTVTNFEWGQCPSTNTCDYPVASSLVH